MPDKSFSLNDIIKQLFKVIYIFFRVCDITDIDYYAVHNCMSKKGTLNNVTKEKKFSKAYANVENGCQIKAFCR